MTKKRRKQRARVWWDIETSMIEVGQPLAFKCAVFMSEGSDTPMIATTEEQALAYINTFQECDFFAHNGGMFDNVWLVTAIQRLDATAWIDTAMQGSRILFMEYGSNRFYDTFTLVPTSLDLFAKSFGFEGKAYPIWASEGIIETDEKKRKKAIAENFLANATLDELAEYCVSDVLMLKKSHLAFVAKMERSFGVSPSFTGAGTAYKVFSERFKTVPLYCGDKANETMRSAYFGGRVENFVIGAVKGPISVFDVNSLYPYCMLGDVPYGTPLIVSDTEQSQVLRDTDFYYAEVQVNCDLGVLPYYSEKLAKLFFPVGRWVGIYTGLDLRVVKATGGDYQIKTRLAFKAKPLFKDYVETLYKLRQDAKKAGDKAGDITYKLLLNSLYGKFGMRRERSSLTITKEEIEAPFVELDSGWRYYLGKQAIEFEDQSVATSAYITSLARNTLLRGLLNNRDKILYCDTDSIHLLGEKADFVGEVDSSKLGAWKYEGTFNSGWYHAPKVYKLVGESETKKAHKGFSEFPEFVGFVEQKPTVNPLKTTLRAGVFGCTNTERTLLARGDKRNFSTTPATALTVEQILARENDSDGDDSN